MQFVNNTPFAAIAWSSMDPLENHYITTVCRIKYKFEDIDSQGVWSLSLDEEQDELFSTDIFYDEDNKYLKYESDYAPYKMQADLILNLSQKQKECSECMVEAIRYKLNSNDNSYTQDTLIKYHTVNGCAFVHRSDESRLSLTGTTDQEWIDTRAPLLPKDFNELHYNAAQASLQLIGEYFLPGDVIVLDGLLDGIKRQMLHIPGAYLKAMVGDISALLEVDTVVLDIDNEDISKNRIHISYRKRILIKKPVESVSLDFQLEKRFIERSA